MTSMRKLNRRLLCWRRYADRVAFNPRIPQPWAWQPPRGYQRAAHAVWCEEERRFRDETPEIWLGGPAGEAALIADVLGCGCIAYQADVNCAEEGCQCGEVFPTSGACTCGHDFEDHESDDHGTGGRCRG